MSALVSSLAFLMLQEGGEEGGGAAAAAGGAVGAIIGLVIAVIIIAAMWKLFTKAGEPGWAAIIPIYNFIVLLKIAGRPVWIDLARKFGKGAGYGIGLAILGFIFFPLLAFSDAQYNPAA